MFPAKLLLFGEYTVMHGSMALAVPFNRFSGKWAFQPPSDLNNRSLFDFADYLEKEESKLIFNIDIKAFKKDLDDGLYFDSTIPIGYGIGSSGALCAAFYQKYAITPVPANCGDVLLPILRKHLSLLESFFHGTSSGIDPLVSYTNSPIVIESNGKLKRLKNFELKNASLFLIDTGVYGNTDKNVKLFQELMEEDYYSATVKNHYVPVVNKCINQIVRGENFFPVLAQLSVQQQALFEPMIPLHFMKYFQQGTLDGDYVLKLCGSGGGGFILGFTLHMDKVIDYFLTEKLNLIIVDYE